MSEMETFRSEAEDNKNILSVSGELDPAQTYTELWMANGQVLRLPTSILLQQTAPANDTAGFAAIAENSQLQDAVTIPLIEEKLEIGKRTVETGTVRLRKTVQTYEEALNEPLAVRTFDVERVILNHPVEVPPPIRHEGNTTIYPLVEEQLILTKQLILKEEVRVTQRDTERHDTQVVVLHREHMIVEREGKPELATSSGITR